MSNNGKIYSITAVTKVQCSAPAKKGGIVQYNFYELGGATRYVISTPHVEWTRVGYLKVVKFVVICFVRPDWK